MIKEKKLEEAEYFLQKMKETGENYKEFEFNLSAFVNAARSVMQYAYNEVEHIPANKIWYRQQVSANKILKFFKDKRNINVHTKPIHVDSRSVTIHVPTTYVILGEQPSERRPEQQPVRSETVNKFTNWDGTEEETFSACQKYLQEIRLFLSEGQKLGYLG